MAWEEESAWEVPGVGFGLLSWLDRCLMGWLWWGGVFGWRASSFQNTSQEPRLQGNMQIMQILVEWNCPVNIEVTWSIGNMFVLLKY